MIQAPGDAHPQLHRRRHQPGPRHRLRQGGLAAHVEDAQGHPSLGKGLSRHPLRRHPHLPVRRDLAVVRQVHGVHRPDHLAGEGGCRQGQDHRFGSESQGQGLEQDGGEPEPHGLGFVSSRYNPAFGQVWAFQVRSTLTVPRAGTLKRF